MPSDKAKQAIPDHWPEAAQYFAEFSEGRLDMNARVGYIYPKNDIRASQDGERLYVGRAGVGGIEFVYRPGGPSIWAYYPIDGEYELKSDDIGTFDQAWLAGDITV